VRSVFKVARGSNLIDVITIGDVHAHARPAIGQRDVIEVVRSLFLSAENIVDLPVVRVAAIKTKRRVMTTKPHVISLRIARRNIREIETVIVGPAPGRDQRLRRDRF